MPTGRRAVSVTLALALLSGGCATPGGSRAGFETLPSAKREECRYNVGAGAVLGAVLGGVLGAAVAGRKSRGEGAALGALGGGVLGAGITEYLRQRCEALRAARARMRAAELEYYQIELTQAAPGAQEAEDQGVVASLASPTMFNVGSAALTPNGLADMTELASVFAQSQRRLLVVGHTDSTGSFQTNVRLSEQRAITVANLFKQLGIGADRIYYKGAGDTEPVDSNLTEQGRARNRRVEVVELGSEDGIVTYNHLAQSDAQFLKRRMENEAASVPPVRRAAIPPQVSPIAPVRPHLPALRAGTRFDFGGDEVSSTGVSLARYVGSPPKTSDGSFLNWLIPQAYAQSPQDEALLRTACVADRDVAEIQVKALATGRPVERRIAGHMRGLYGSSWSRILNGHLVGVGDVSVRQDGGQVDAAPTVFVFQNYKSGDQKPTLDANGGARTYVGDKGVLYRLFVEKKGWPLRCIDFVFSKSETARAAYGRLYYDKQGAVYGVDFQAEPVSKKSSAEGT